MCRECNGCMACQERSFIDWDLEDRIWDHHADDYEERKLDNGKEDNYNETAWHFNWQASLIGAEVGGSHRLLAAAVCTPPVLE